MTETDLTGAAPPPPPAQPGSEADMAAALRAQRDAAGITDVNVPALIAAMQQQMQAMQAQIDQYAAAQGPIGDHPLLATAKRLQAHLADNDGHATHVPAQQLAADLVEASGHAAASGDLTHVRTIIGKLERWARRHPAPPGESFHQRQAADLIAFHLPDQLDSFRPLPKRVQVESDRDPVPVVTGSVVG